MTGPSINNNQKDITNNSYTKNNHFVQKALIRNFSTKKSEDKYSVQIFSHKEKIGGCSNIQSVFKEQYFYTQEIEELLNTKVETEVSSTFNDIKKSAEKIELKRDAVNLLKKYVLLQEIRTPKSLKKIYFIVRSEAEKNKDSRFKDDLGPNESDNDFWTRVMKVVLEKDWNDLLKCGISLVRYVVWNMNGFFPMIIRSPCDLILPDTGVYTESTSFVRPPIDSKGRLEQVCGKEFTKKEANDIMSELDRYMNFIALPFDKNHVILFVDDFWRLSFYNDPVRDVGIRSQFLDKSFVPPIVIYENAEGINSMSQHVEKFFDRLSSKDEFTIIIQEITENEASLLNVYAIESSEQIFAFKDINNIIKSIEKYIHYHKVGRSKYDISLCLSRDYNKRYPKKIDYDI